MTIRFAAIRLVVWSIAMSAALKWHWEPNGVESVHVLALHPVLSKRAMELVRWCRLAKTGKDSGVQGCATRFRVTPVSAPQPTRGHKVSGAGRKINLTSKLDQNYSHRLLLRCILACQHEPRH
jgi:hypothetical protein